MKIQATLNAFLWQKYSSISADAILSADDLSEDDRAKVVSALTFTCADLGFDGEYLPVGVAQVTVELMNKDQMVTGQVDALKAMKKRVMAEAQREINRIDEKISKLQAISFDG